MHRRTFQKQLIAGFVTGSILSACRNTAAAQTTDGRILPPRLKKGARVGLITPGSYIPDRDLNKAIQNLETLGFRPVQAPNLRAKRGYNAGTDQQRLDDLHQMFADPDIDAVWCARGGYGCTRLLPHIDYDLIRNHPKVLIGYSDITALLQAVHQKTGLVCFHGPVAASTMTPYTRQCLTDILMQPRAGYTIRITDQYQDATDRLFQTQTLSPGKAQGRLAGGNLSLLASLSGTEFQLDPAGKIIFMEDVEEKPYRVDRMLTQLRQADGLERAAGFALGIFNDCVPEPEDESLHLVETIEDRLKPLGRPLVYGLSFGHIAHQCTLPVGIEAEFDAEAQTITLLEKTVV